MSRIVAATEKRSDGVELFVWWVFQVLRTVGLEEDDEAGGVTEEPEEPEEEEWDETKDRVEGIFRGFWPQGVRRCLAGVASLFPEDEDEDDKANEKRLGEPGSPMRITVPFEAAEAAEAAESGRGKTDDVGDIGDIGEVSSRGARASFSGFLLRAVRPPDGRIVRLVVAAGWAGAAVRIQRSGAEYWYDSRSLTRGGARRESRAWNCPR
jgi:hypothetical protein